MSERLWTRDFVLAFVINLLMSMPFYLLMTSMAAYAAQRFHAGDALAGFASSAFIVGAVIARVLAGKYLDFIGRRRSIVAALAVFVLASLAYIPAGSMGLLLAIRLVHGIAFGFGNTALNASVQSLIPAARRGEGTGYFGTSSSLATALGPFLAVFLSSHFGFGWVFGACEAFALLGLGCALALRLPERTPEPDEVRAKWRLELGTLIDARSAPVSFAMFLAGMAYSVVLTFLAGYAGAMGAPGAASLFFVVFAVGMLASRLFVGRLQDVYGDNAVAYPIFAAYALGIALVAWAPGPWAIVVAALPMGVGFGSLLPVVQAIVVKLVTPARVGVAVATFFILLDVGTGIGPVVLGGLQPALGAGGMYWAAAGLVVLAAGVYWWAHGRGPRGRRGYGRSAQA